MTNLYVSPALIVTFVGTKKSSELFVTGPASLFKIPQEDSKPAPKNKFQLRLLSSSNSASSSASSSSTSASSSSTSESKTKSDTSHFYWAVGFMTANNELEADELLSFDCSVDDVVSLDGALKALYTDKLSSLVICDPEPATLALPRGVEF
jgi:hypothetical protein